MGSSQYSGMKSAQLPTLCAGPQYRPAGAFTKRDAHPDCNTDDADYAVPPSHTVDTNPNSARPNTRTS